MIGYNLALGAIVAAKMKMDFAVMDLGSLRNIAEKERNSAQYLLFGEPASRGAKMCPDNFEAQTLGQIMKERRGVGKKARSPTGAKTRLWTPYALPQGTGLPYLWLTVKL